MTETYNSFDDVMEKFSKELFDEQKRHFGKNDFRDYLLAFLVEINKYQMDKIKLRDQWFGFNKDELLEILACLEDSDRYIIEGQKNRMITELKERIYHDKRQNTERVSTNVNN